MLMNTMPVAEFRTENKVNQKSSVFLCDLTHVKDDVLSSNVFPLGAGLIGSFLLASDIGNQFDVELFKYPNDLNNKLKASRPPKIVGFANYSWTFEISLEFASNIKRRFPDTTIVFGGPNYGLTEGEKSTFWRRAKGMIDFNIVFEGEESFLKLVRLLLENDFDIRKAKDSASHLTNVHFINNEGLLEESDLSPRTNIEDLPSPYLDTQLMDKFFDGRLVPLAHTTRGCPFKCTFCSEGASFYNKVKQRTSRVYEEFRLIADKSTAAGTYDLFLSDANFGMFREDHERASSLAAVKSETGYPKNVYVSTGKNAKERVLNVVQIMEGAIQLSASLQSTSPDVLDHIERSNISIDALSDAAREASNKGVQSYTELILGLPGETLQTHMDSIHDVIKAGFDNVRIYQLILLPQTKLNTDETRSSYGLKTKFRPMPRSYGKYEIFDVSKVVVEYEEIVTSTNAMPEADYATARQIGLLVDIVHNGNLFLELKRYLKQLSLNWSDFMMHVFECFQSRQVDPELTLLFDEFIDLMNDGLFPSKEALIDFVGKSADEEAVGRVVLNELAAMKARIIVTKFHLINNFVYHCLKSFLTKKEAVYSAPLIKSLADFSLQQKQNLFDKTTNTVQIELPSEEINDFGNIVGVNLSHLTKENFTLQLKHDRSQAEQIAYFHHMYGDSLEGWSRTVMRFPMLSQIFREIDNVKH